ncbi:HepT-like ribonuclease domain-containing protein [Paracraurococcus lichenis]|uniref:DUF86 domain-containing protein n=1 Tax=Paracraurococcus lichenis TaxID=3064888 RepID=A0ABT9E3T9_9PROT|nr:HepT-like ribonuclease domain-containing protein [Paracraurococcus sp. LOR1-02]MDO9710833.1 DUF86 domain-containing protein [Paracraurococcus sp. LOR1-02]
MAEAIRNIEAAIAGVTPDAFEADWRSRWLVERGLEIVSEASRHLPPAMKARHAAVPWRKVAGIGNVLRHEYHRVAPPILWALLQQDLPALRDAVEAEIAAIRAGPEG